MMIIIKVARETNCSSIRSNLKFKSYFFVILEGLLFLGMENTFYHAKPMYAWNGIASSSHLVSYEQWTFLNIGHKNGKQEGGRVALKC